MLNLLLTMLKGIPCKKGEKSNLRLMPTGALLPNGSPPPATYNCICLSRNAAKVNSQGCKPLEIALSMHHSRNAATVQFRDHPTTLAQD